MLTRGLPSPQAGAQASCLRPTRIQANRPRCFRGVGVGVGVGVVGVFEILMFLPRVCLPRPLYWYGISGILVVLQHCVEQPKGLGSSSAALDHRRPSPGTQRARAWEHTVILRRSRLCRSGVSQSVTPARVDQPRQLNGRWRYAVRAILSVATASARETAWVLRCSLCLYTVRVIVGGYSAGRGIRVCNGLPLGWLRAGSSQVMRLCRGACLWGWLWLV